MENPEKSPEYENIIDNIFKFIEESGYDSLSPQMKEKLQELHSLDYELQHGVEKEELMEIYRTGDAEIDSDFEKQLEQNLLKLIKNRKKDILLHLEGELSFLLKDF